MNEIEMTLKTKDEISTEIEGVVAYATNVGRICERVEILDLLRAKIDSARSSEIANALLDLSIEIDRRRIDA